jgi:hypothetical protein
MAEGEEVPVCAQCQQPITGESLEVDEAMYGFETSYLIHPECWLTPIA